MNKYRILVKGIVQKGNRYLTVEKWYDDNIVEPYQWEFIDGEAEFGESPDKAVVRNIQEQTGLITEVDRVLYTWTFMDAESAIWDWRIFALQNRTRMMLCYRKNCMMLSGLKQLILKITSIMNVCLKTLKRRNFIK